ncbi:MAG: peptidoglycan D,D-transpeptidase FtsI family protein [Phycisphaerales bacterium]
MNTHGNALSSRAAELTTRFQRTAAFALILTLLLLAVMIGRVAQLQLAPSEALVANSSARTLTKRLLPIRGDILDRRGRLLSATRFGERVYVDPTMLPNPPDEAIVKLAKLTGVEEEFIGAEIMKAIDFNAAYYAANPRPGSESQVEKADALRRLLERGMTPARPAVASPEPTAADEVGEGDSDPTGAGANAPPKPKKPKPIRFVPITKTVPDEVAQRVREAKIPGVGLESLPVREYPGGEDVSSIIGQVGVDQKGLMGTEWLSNSTLTGSAGKMTYVRDAKGRPLWTEAGEVVPPKPGNDIQLTIDLELQRMAKAELERGIMECDAAGGRLVLADPQTGEILAMVDLVRDLPELAPYPWVEKPVLKRGQKAPPEPNVLARPRRYITIDKDEGRAADAFRGRNRCIEDIYEPGSTFKPFVWSVITELHLAKMDEVFDTEGGRWHTSYGRYIEDVTRRATMTWPDVLKNSSNIGMIKAAERLSPKQLREAIVRFGFGRPTGVGLPGEASGIVTPASRWTKFTHTSVAYGHEIAVTPVQMIQGFCAFAREGEMAGTLPNLRMVVKTASGDPVAPSFTYRVLPREVALVTREPMAGVVSAMEERWAKGDAGGWRYRLFGKSGTAEIPLGKAPKGMKRPRGSSGYYDDQYNSSFIAAGPIESPRLVCIVVIDDPGPERIHKKSHYGAATAGPIVRRFMEQALAYVGAPVSVREEPKAEQVPAVQTR